MNTTKQSKGGIERAKKLSSSERKAIAIQAAQKRWAKLDDPNYVPVASHQGILAIGDMELDCYVLGDRRRLFNKKEIAKALGLKSEGGSAFIRTITRKGIDSVLSKKLRASIDNPIQFRTSQGTKAHGYEGTILIDICHAILQAKHKGKLASSQEFLALQAEFIILAAAKTGIIALIDEATGFIADKKKEEYRELFKEFIREELKEWEKEFPDQFFEMIYRLYGLKRNTSNAFQHPSFFGKFIRKYIYYPLANSNGAILEILDEKNPVVYYKGGRQYKFHQFLSEIGDRSFKNHLWQVMGIGNSSRNNKEFERAFYRAFPKFGTQFELDFMD